jgi:hypothetical protein
MKKILRSNHPYCWIGWDVKPYITDGTFVLHCFRDAWLCLVGSYDTYMLVYIQSIH